MKTETINHVPREELLRMLIAFVEKAGTQYKAAQKLGVMQGNFNRMMNGHKQPGRKLLDAFGLEIVTVYVPKTKESK